MRATEERAVRAYEERFGGEPEVVTSAPGRVNLIGEHTDYNGGFVLPYAIDRRVAVAAGKGDGGLFSADFEDLRPLSGERGSSSWADYPRGVAWSLGEAGHRLGDFRAAFAGDVPLGAGLSSSAAIESATALALDGLYGLGIERRDLALVCQRAENEYVGLRSGIMDQYASLLCEEDSALLIDCKELRAESVPLGFDGAGLSVLVCDTRVEHGSAETGYNARRKTCDEAALSLGVGLLRDAAESDLKRLSGEELKRARHVVTENRRVLEAVEKLGEGDFEGFGGLMYASHRSMRDDFEISTAEIDAFVEYAREGGALGARLTGGGFGGCAIALIASDGAKPLADETRRGFAARGFREPSFHEFRPAAGAQNVTL